MRKNIKRVIAGVLSAVLTLGLVNLSALSMSLASELSGYEIGVEYASDNSSATLTGNTSGVKEGVQLDKLVDGDGQELDPTDFSQTVEENGTYHFTLHYLETVADQDGTEETIEAKTQELEVVVNGIVAPESQETPAADTEVAKENVPNLSSSAAVEAAKTAVPVDVLQRSMATALAEGRATSTIKVDIYASEVEYKLQTVEFGGGNLVPGTPGLPDVANRTFASASWVQADAAEFAITGLFFYNSKWYYTVSGNSQSSGDAGNVGVGFELPTGATVRLYYEVSNTTKYQLSFSGGNGNLTSDYALTVNGGTYSGLRYAAGSKVILEFNLPTIFSDAYINIPNVSFAKWMSAAVDEKDAALADKVLIKGSDLRYTLMFTMPSMNVTVNFSGTVWPSGATYSVCLGTTANLPQPGEQVTNSYFKTISGTTAAATLTHNAGGSTVLGGYGTYSYGSSSQDLSIGNSTQIKFAKGSYQAGSTLKLDLRMNRWYDAFDVNPYYTWKPTFLILQVYLGTTFPGNDFAQYYIPLANKLNGTTNTELDFGATVTTRCTDWGNQKYQYTITVEKMYHNFAIYDKPVSTIQQNFLLVGLDGIDVAASSMEDKRSGEDSANYWPIQLWDLYLGQNAKYTGSINFYLEPKFGYTVPVGNMKNGLAVSVLHNREKAYPTKGNRYWCELEVGGTDLRDGNKSPALITFTSKPMTFKINYCQNGQNDPYHPTGVTMSVSQNSNYAIEYKVPNNISNLKGYYVKVFNANKEVGTIKKSDNTKLWYPNQDVISFTYVYNQLRAMNVLPSDPNCEVRIIPVAGTAGQGVVTANYKVKLQSKFDSGLNKNTKLSASNSTEPKKMQGNIQAYAGTTVNLFGYKEQFEDKSTGKQYKLNGNTSVYGGPVQEGQTIATLEYALATQVRVDVSTLKTGNSGEAWNLSQQNSWYTGINEFSQSVSLANLDHGEEKGWIFDGWGIKKTDGTVVRKTSNMGSETGLNLYMVGSADINLWNDIFDNGSCTLVAIWRSAVKTVYSSNGTLVNSNNPRIEIQSTMAEMQITAEFRYGDDSEAVNPDDLLDLYNSNELNVKLFKKDPGSSWQVRNPGTNIEGPVFSVGSTASNFKVTFTIKSGVTTPSYNDGANFRILAWTSANDTSNLTLTNNGIAQHLNSADDSIKVNGQAPNKYLNSYETNLDYDNPFEDKIPSVNTNTIIPSKVTLTNDQIDLDSSGYVGIIQNQTQSLTITGKFKYGGGNKTEGDIQALFDSGSLRIALFKKDPGVGKQWTVRYPSGSSGIAKPTITQGSENTFEVTFTITSSVSSTWNNGANFRIYTWTSANVNGTTVTADNVLAALNGTMTYETQIPGVNTYTEFIYPVKSEGGTEITNKTQSLQINDGATSFGLTGTFRYSGTADETKLIELFNAGELKIGLLKKNPPENGGTTQGPWEVVDAGVPRITKAADSLDFEVSFTIDQDITGQSVDGASYRILVWTDANATKDDGSSLEVTDVKDALSSYTDEIPSVTTNTTMLYEIIRNGDPTSTVTVLATETSISLSVTFKYDFDTTRYPNGYKGGTRLRDLIDNGDITATLEYSKDKGKSWTTVNVESTTALGPWDATNGIIRFTYTFTPTTPDKMSDFDGAQFKISVKSNANTAPAEHTTTIVYVADGSGYVTIPEYVILDDNNSKVLENGKLQDGYAGKGTQVSYNTDATTKPSIRVKVQDGVKLRKDSINGEEMEDMAIRIYSATGVEIKAGDDGYSTIGTLTSATSGGSIPFWMNVKRGTVKNQQYYAVVNFLFELVGTTT